MKNIKLNEYHKRVIVYLICNGKAKSIGEIREFCAKELKQGTTNGTPYSRAMQDYIKEKIVLQDDNGNYILNPEHPYNEKIIQNKLVFKGREKRMKKILNYPSLGDIPFSNFTDYGGELISKGVINKVVGKKKLDDLKKKIKDLL